MSKQPNNPLYFMQPGNSVIAQWKQAFEMFSRKDAHTFTLNVPPEVVEEGKDVAMIQEMIVALQHYPHLIDKFIFAVELKFQQVADSELYYQKDDWKTDSKYYRWFCKMGTFPLVLFFLDDKDARLYTLAGDIMADRKVSAEKVEGKKYSILSFEGKQVQLLTNRLANACWMFHLYCHGGSFDPQPCIEYMLAEFKLPITYEQVRKKYEEDVKKGIKLRVQ